MTGASSGWIPPMFPAQGRIHKTNQQLANNRSQLLIINTYAADQCGHH